MSTPLFQSLCIDFEELLQTPDLKTMLAIALKQSKTEQASLNTDPINYIKSKQELKEDHTPECPLYFGMFVEWLAQHFLNQYGKYWNIENVKMLTNTTNDNIDVGIDGEGITPHCNKFNVKLKGQKPLKPGAPVFLQVKGTVNPTKVYKPNDGSRLGNFFAAAQHEAGKRQQFYSARYVIFHTGKCINDWFENYGGGEEIGFKDISEKMDGSYSFLNVLRQQAGLKLLPIPKGMVDDVENER